MTEKTDNEKLRVLLMKPGERAEIAEIDDNLDELQRLVEGNIEEYMPFYDEADPRVSNCAIICNEEGKMRGMEANRAIYDENGQVQEIIAGPFFICYAPIESERFLSMPPDLEEKMKKKFDYPEQFFRNGTDIKAVKYDPNHGSRETAQER